MSESQLNSRDITFRTVFHDVEGIKSYLRKLRNENERVIKNIEGVVKNAIDKVINESEELYNIISGMVNSSISPLKTEWISDYFISFIAENISDTTVNLISNSFMSIIDYNSGDFNAYINSALTTDRIEAFISPLKTEWISDYFISFIAENISDTTVNLISNSFMSIIDYNSGDFNAYINSALTTDRIEAFISPLKTEWISDYHLFKKYYTTLTESITVNVGGTLTPTTALKRFRILAYISGDNATDNLHYKYTSTAITEDAYTVVDGNLQQATLTIANLVTGDTGFNVIFNTEDANVDYKSYLGGILWYGFTDLIDPSLLT